MVNFAAMAKPFIAQAGAIVSLDARSISTTFLLLTFNFISHKVSIFILQLFETCHF